jgi:hypothetical protein
MLTDDQADFVNNLHANNVPAGAIARVVEKMIAGERQLRWMGIIPFRHLAIIVALVISGDLSCIMEQ